MEQLINKKNKIKYTVQIPIWYVSELKELASLKVIQSVNNGFQIALESFIKETKKSIYLKNMQDAGKDKKFLERTKIVNDEFEKNEDDLDKSW